MFSRGITIAEFKPGIDGWIGHCAVCGPGDVRASSSSSVKVISKGFCLSLWAGHEGALWGMWRRGVGLGNRPLASCPLECWIGGYYPEEEVKEGEERDE